MAVDAFAPRLSFFFDSHNDLLEEVAKFRASRVLWAELMRDRYGAREESSWKLRFHAQTAGCTLQAQQPEVNLIRVAYQALAAVFGGCQSLHTNSLDETLSLPSDHAVTLALRTQQILAHETGIPAAVDPFGGSYCVEVLTRRMKEAAQDYFRRIEEHGGMLAAIENGYFRREIAESAFACQQKIDQREQLIVGVNAFTQPEEARPPAPVIDAEGEAEQVVQLKRLRASRDNARVRSTLNNLRRAAEEQRNVFPELLEAAGARASVQECMDALASIYGRFHPTWP
jgi:methylmalonyl-CoA mutase N-terminal domain/subunit